MPPHGARNSGRAVEEALQLLPLRKVAGTNTLEDDNDTSDDNADIFAEEDHAASFEALNRNTATRPRSGLSWLLSIFHQRRNRSTRPNSFQRRPIVVAGLGGPWKLRLTMVIFAMTIFWVVLFAFALPSYSHPPPRYVELRHRAQSGSEPGRGNIHNEKIFIAASVYDPDGRLLSGTWGKTILALVDLLGPRNVFVSVFENDASDEAIRALERFKSDLTCEHAVVNEHIETIDLKHVRMSDGRLLLKRIAFLARVRNRALAPLYDLSSPASKTAFDKILYVNDIIFDPIDAANLLFSTAVDDEGRTKYRAACAVDFINPFKFYDTFATRDLEGFDLGVPFFPWFTNAGNAASRTDVLAQKDAVRVKSCWGGMIALKALHFQPALITSITEQTTTNESLANVLRFRAEQDDFWDASECCLINADIQEKVDNKLGNEVGIYMNPYVRVAYDPRTLSWLGFTRRFERLYTPVQYIANLLGRRPSMNSRRLDQVNTIVKHRVWVPGGAAEDGSYQDVERVAEPGGFCGNKMLLALPEDGDGSHWFKQTPPADINGQIQ